MALNIAHKFIKRLVETVELPIANQSSRSKFRLTFKSLFGISPLFVVFP